MNDAEKYKELMKEFEALKAQIAATEAKFAKSEIENKNLRLTIKLLLAREFGARAEKRKVSEIDQSQVDLAFPGMNITASPENNIVAPKPVKAIRKPEQGRQEIPAHIPRVQEILDLKEEQKACECCGEPMNAYSHDITEILAIEPLKFFVRQISRPKYACSKHPENGVHQMSLPERIIPKGNADESLLTFLITSKYVDHLPIERQLKIMSRFGVKVAKSTAHDWVNATAEYLKPLHTELNNVILESKIINADETTLLVQNNSKKDPVIHGYLWAYLGDKSLISFDFQDGRSKKSPIEFLEKWQGKFLQTDAYAGYNEVIQQKNLLAIPCWAHIRRKFYDAEKLGMSDATLFLNSISKLYQIEAQVRENNLKSVEIQILRQKESVSIINEIIALSDQKSSQYTPSSPMGKALTYLNNLHPKLKNYCTDGDLEIDNNIIERAIRPIALGRKNWLFAGSENGAKHSALIYSLTGSCALNDVEPHFYFSMILRMMPNTDPKEYRNLLPDRFNDYFDKWAKAQKKPGFV